MSAGSYDFTMGADPYAEAFRNVNPLTAQLMPQFQNLITSSLNQGPNQFMNQFMAAVPGLQGISTSATSDMALQQQEALRQMTGQTISQVGNELSKIGGVNSSAYPRLIGEAMAPEIAQMNTQLSAQRANLFGGLAQTAMPLFAQQQQMGLQAAGLIGGLLNPDMVAPDLAYMPSSWEQYGMPLMQSLIGAGGTYLGTL